MKSLPTISVIVPSYNQGQFLAECLDSILAQNYPALQLIVMDGGSSDQSVDVIRRFEEKLDYWQSEPDGGQSAAINAGVARAHGDLVAWLNSDDLYHDGALWTVARAWMKHPDRGLYIGNGFRLNDETKQLTRHVSRHMAFSRQALREGLDYVLQPSAFFSLASWRAVDGLDERLQFCMDWDILIRIADRDAVVLIDDFLGVSREYESTKTASGGFRRLDELLRMVKFHTGQNMTIGGSVFALWTLLAEQMGPDDGAVRQHVDQARFAAQQRLALLGAFLDGSPDRSDPGDISYLPFPDPDMPTPPAPERLALPTISVIVPVFNQARHLERTLTSVLDQGYPNLETIVVDRGSTDGSAEIIGRLGGPLSHWQTAPDPGLGAAINQGIARSTGNVIVWLIPGDMMAEGALHTVGSAFAADEQLDLLHGDALLVDERDQPFMINHAGSSSGIRIGEAQERNRIPAYWSYRHGVSQPTFYFRRRLVDRLGGVAEQYWFIVDIELLFRFGDQAKFSKIAKVLAFERVWDDEGVDPNARTLCELYEFSRNWWPDRKAPAFQQTRDHFLSTFMERYRQGAPAGLMSRAVRTIVSLLVTYRLANPERILARHKASGAVT